MTDTHHLSKLPSLIYPSDHQIQFSLKSASTIPPPQKKIAKSNLPSQIAKNSDLPSIKLASMINPPPKIAKSDLLLKSPQNLIYLQIGKYDLLPPPPSTSSEILNTFFPLQHHALLHKGLFCERPINYRANIPSVMTMLKKFGCNDHSVTEAHFCRFNCSEYPGQGVLKPDF